MQRTAKATRRILALSEKHGVILSMTLSLSLSLSLKKIARDCLRQARTSEEQKNERQCLASESWNRWCARAMNYIRKVARAM